jgi:hypothetical protein
MFDFEYSSEYILNDYHVYPAEVWCSFARVACALRIEYVSQNYIQRMILLPVRWCRSHSAQFAEL